MFVVAIVANWYNDDAGYSQSSYLDQLYSSTASAEAEIARLIFEKKKKQYFEKKEREVNAGFEKIFDDCKPEPPYRASFDNKPKFDHDRAREKGYQEEHRLAVQKWKDEEFSPISKAHSKWVGERYEYVEAQSKPVLEDMMRFPMTVFDIGEEILSESATKYTTKVLEVFP